MTTQAIKETRMPGLSSKTIVTLKSDNAVLNALANAPDNMTIGEFKKEFGNSGIFESEAPKKTKSKSVKDANVVDVVAKEKRKGK